MLNAYIFCGLWRWLPAGHPFRAVSAHMHNPFHEQLDAEASAPAYRTETHFLLNHTSPCNEDGSSADTEVDGSTDSDPRVSGEGSMHSLSSGRSQSQPSSTVGGDMDDTSSTSDDGSSSWWQRLG